MRLRTMILIPLVLVGLAVCPAADSAEAVDIQRLVLSVSGSGGSAKFSVRATLYWTATEWLNQTAIKVETTFYGIDGNTARPVLAHTVVRQPGNSLIHNFRLVATNGNRWANEDKDGLFSKRRDEIRVRIRLYDENDEVIGDTGLSNMVTGNF